MYVFYTVEIGYDVSMDTSHVRRYMQRWLRLLHDGSTAFARLPKDILRYVIAPMVLHPYVVRAGMRDVLILSSPTSSYIGTVRVDGEIAGFSKTKYGYATISKSGFLRHYGMHGLGDVTYYNPGSQIVFDNHSVYYIAVWDCSLLTASRYDINNMIPDPEQRVLRFQFADPPGMFDTVIVIFHHYEHNYVVLWDRACTLRRAHHDAGSAHVSIVDRTIPSGFVSVYFSFGRFVCAYPWGETVEVSMFFVCKKLHIKGKLYANHASSLIGCCVILTVSFNCRGLRVDARKQAVAVLQVQFGKAAGGMQFNNAGAHSVVSACELHPVALRGCNLVNGTTLNCFTASRNVFEMLALHLECLRDHGYVICHNHIVTF